ncbi:MAG: hypothetical protein FJ279_07975 [Planctomycetes bacterium]|nr:hypothetical protein [Planctomycetota bacterium]
MRRFRCPHCGRATKMSHSSHRRMVRGRMVIPVGIVAGVVSVCLLKVGELAILGVALSVAAVVWGIHNGLLRKPAWTCDTCGILFRAHAWETRQPAEPPQAEPPSVLPVLTGSNLPPAAPPGRADIRDV